MIYLDVDDLLHIAGRVLGSCEVRDRGLLDAAAARPLASAFGEDAYTDIHEKVAALVHSVAKNHALLDGNKRLALAAEFAFYGVNGWRLTLYNDDAYQLIMGITSGNLDDVTTIAGILRAAAVPALNGAPR